MRMHEKRDKHTVGQTQRRKGANKWNAFVNDDSFFPFDADADGRSVSASEDCIRVLIQKHTSGRASRPSQLTSLVRAAEPVYTDAISSAAAVAADATAATAAVDEDEDEDGDDAADEEDENREA